MYSIDTVYIYWGKWLKKFHICPIFSFSSAGPWNWEPEDSQERGEGMEGEGGGGGGQRVRERSREEFKWIVNGKVRSRVKSCPFA